MTSERGSAVSPSEIPTESGRDAYADVGAATRGAIVRAIDGDALNAPAKVLLAVMYLLATYSRLTDRVYVDQVADVAGVHRRTVERWLKRWHELGVIEWEPRRGRRSASWVSLGPASTTRPLVAAIAGGKTRPQSPGKPGQIALENTATVAALPRRTEKVPEEDDVAAELAELLRPVGQVYPGQWGLFKAALSDDRGWFRRCVQEASRAPNPVASLTILVKAGPRSVTAAAPVERAEAWVRNAGCLYVRQDFLEELEQLFDLSGLERDRLVDLFDELQAPRAAEGAG